MGVGLTLTAANTVFFLDVPWNWAKYSQACDRAHRIGQNDKVTVVNLVTKNTIDEKIYGCLQRKGNAVDELYMEMGLKSS